eukprot:jgi/Mesvir1/14412/Mv09798-RA.1
MDIFSGSFVVLVVICIACLACKRFEVKEDTSKSFVRFQRNYLVVYLLALAADWLQGPYVYALYDHYGYTRGEIAVFFIAGYISSLLFGTLCGLLADTFGRKKICLLYCCAYSIGCATKHFNNTPILMLGRVCAGVSTSILFSAFEAWMVSQHNKHMFKSDWLSLTFGTTTLYNAVVAILSGIVANVVVDWAGLNLVVPFDLAICALVLCGTAIVAGWEENYGLGAQADVKQILQGGMHSLWNDQRILLLGLVQSLFEGSMYTFVFLWTPSLQAGGQHIPHGLVFACFMVCIMIGSTVASILLHGHDTALASGTAHAHAHTRESPRESSDGSSTSIVNNSPSSSSASLLLLPKGGGGGGVAAAAPPSGPGGVSTRRHAASWHRVYVNRPPESYLRFVFLLASAAMMAAAMTENTFTLLLAFFVFETCVGIFWPSQMKLRSQYVPEEFRTSLMVFFRIPLNMIVVMVLLKAGSLKTSTVYAFCAAWLMLAAVCQQMLLSLFKKAHRHPHTSQPKLAPDAGEMEP